MRKSLAVLALGALVMFTAPALAQVYVPGYTKRDGTYVQPHYRSSPNKSYNDNWSVSPNTNPYTGKRGTRAPTWDNRPPAYNPYGGRRLSPYGKRSYR